jgi:4-hydroxybenzoate polyprenyltransferase
MQNAPLHPSWLPGFIATKHRPRSAFCILHAAFADLYHFFRVSAFGATAVLPLLGAGSADPKLPPRRTLGLLAVATAFHAFAYVHNDVCDLPLDRTQPRRAMYPLVRGQISPRAALAVALACVPLAFILHERLVAGASRPRAFTASRPHGPHGLTPRAYLALAFALMAAYNRWGKRCPFPPLTDLLQALGWAALLRYGAAAAECQRPSRPASGAALIRLLGAYELLLIMMVNGLHGALRDLANDAAGGARTTAILFGAQARADGGIQVPPALIAYAGLLQAALIALPFWAVAANSAGQAHSARLAAALGVGAVEAATLAVLAAARRHGVSTELGMAHLVLLLSAPIALVAPGLARHLRAALLAAHLAPLLSNGLTYETMRWAVQSAAKTT